MSPAFRIDVAAVAAPRPAQACSSPMAPPPAAIPRTGATDVSTATSIVILSSSQPSQVEVTAGTGPVPTDGVTPIGAGIDGVTGQLTQFWRVRIGSFLPPSTEIVVSIAGPAGGARMNLSSFRTAASYDKTPAHPRRSATSRSSASATS